MSGLVDPARIARRLRRWIVLLVGATLLAWLVGGLVGDGPTLRGLAELVGVAVLLALLVEVFIVGGSAVAAALRAGEQGERLSAADVSLVPPQVGARLRRRRAAGGR